MRLKATILIVLFFVVQQFLYAQKSEYQFSHLDISNGLSNNRINWIHKDANGFMWFGTYSGLNRYDGFKFKIFRHDVNNPHSLMANYIYNMYDGPDGKMWVFTHNGISIYNSITETFINDIAPELARYHVTTNQLTAIKKDNDGNFWFLTNNQGIYRFHPSTGVTDFYSTSIKDGPVLHSNYVTDVVESKNRLIWLMYNDGVIDELDPGANKIIFRDFAVNKSNNAKPENYEVMFGRDNNMWIHATSSTIGVYCYNSESKKLIHFCKENPDANLNSDVIYSIVQGDDNNIWIGTDHGGINLVDMDTHKIAYLLNSSDDEKSISGNSDVLYKDNTGIIWCGSFKQGISYYHKGIFQFPLVRHYLSNSASLPYEDVNCFLEDADGNLWIGTNGGGIIFYNKATKKYTQYKHDPADPNSLSNDVVIALFIDHEKNFWIGTYFGGLERMEGGKFVHYRHKDNVPGSISDDRIYSIMEDSQLNLWVGTFAGGLNIYDRKTQSFTHPVYPMSSDYTSTIFEDNDKNIWIGRDKGIDVISKDRRSVRHYLNDPKNSNSLISSDVNCIFQDKSGLFWIGTKEGISILDVKTGKFTNFDEDKGLPNNNVWSILEDKNGLIWISTANGLANIDLIKTGSGYNFEIRRYDEFDGLQGKEYNAYAAYKTRDGEMIFGGGHGFNIFRPESIHNNQKMPELLFTDFQLFNKSVKVGDTIENRVVLDKSITYMKSLTLNHDQNVFSIEFAVCDYFNPDKITYQYQLENFDKGWLTAPRELRKATYTNLDAGDYTFKVRASNTNEPGSVRMITLHIEILPPFWKSTWAYVLYFILVIGLLLYIRHRGIENIKREFEIKQDKLEAEQKIAKEREEARRMHELDLMKIKFFTNVSHEFRTPLSLIVSPIDNLIKNNTQPEQQQQLAMIKRNGKRLLNLVNQLLDFRKMEFKELKLNLTRGDIIRFIKDVCSSFADLADQNHIGYLFDSEVDSLTTRFDHDKIERVLFNLLSNSFKFTPPGGHISVFITLNEKRQDNELQMLEIKVMDTGIGIPKEKQEKIFERFFQDNLPEGLLNQGSGIGLSISKEFIKMHDGDIFVESEPGNGSCFTIRIPVGIDSNKAFPEVVKTRHVEIAKQEEHILDSAKKPVVLLIEDNDDLRFYLKDNLKQAFNIIEAVNGKDGWQKTLALHPNLIVSDVSMPEMNGLELCGKIRHDERTAHIPIILLTALTEEEDQLAGTAKGANDYITKPFNFEILLSKINGLLLMQQTLKKTYQKQVDIKAQDLEIVSEDQKFLKNTLNCIEKNITNPNFSVEELSRQMSLSRVSLYKRLLTLTGKTPVDCIRTIRLKRAVQLLEKSKLSIASVAYEVGFNNPTYFSKVFKEEYGTLPSEYVNEIRKKEKEQLQPTSDF